MGCSISSPIYYEPTDYPNNILKKDKEGDVYLMVYADDSSEGDSNLVQNYSVLIDVAGESTNDKDNSGGAYIPKGIEIYLIIKDGVATVKSERTDRIKSKFQSYKLLGKIENVYHKNNPKEWSEGLTHAALNFYNQFINQNGTKWNSKCNSHQFSKFIINQLSINNPHQLSIPSDIYIAGDKDNSIPIYFNIFNN